MISIEENTILFNINWQVFLEKLTVLLQITRTGARSVETGIIIVVGFVTEFSHSHSAADMQARFDDIVQYSEEVPFHH